MARGTRRRAHGLRGGRGSANPRGFWRQRRCVHRYPGSSYVELALELGVPKERIDTIIDFAAAEKHGVKTKGNSDAATADVLFELAGFMNAGRLEIPIAKVYPLANVRDAYRELEKHHTRGQIVLQPYL